MDEVRTPVNSQTSSLDNFYWEGKKYKCLIFLEKVKYELLR